MKVRIAVVFTLLLFYQSISAVRYNVIRLSLGDGVLKVTPYTDKIIRIQYALWEEALQKHSLVVTLSPQENNFILLEQGAFFLLKNSFGTLSVDKLTGAIRLKDQQDHFLIKDKEGEAKQIKGKDGTYYQVANYFTVDSIQQLYSMALHSPELLMLGCNEYATAASNPEPIRPFVISSANYGIFWDNFCQTKVGDKPALGTYFISGKARSLDYYFILGSSMEEVINGYLKLIGEATEFPE